MRKHFSLLVSLVMLATAAFSQVTSSSITGTVKGDGNAALASATVVAVHQPSGTKYSTTTNKAGAFTILNVRVGGPYTVTITYSGFQKHQEEGVYAPLGNTANVDVTMKPDTKTMEGVVIRGVPNPILNSKTNGASVTIGRQAINLTPTIGRNVNDVTKYNAYSNGRSFAGQDSRFNNFTIDGAVFNNGFGLGSDAQAGGRTNSTAISLDALEELQINITPYDIKQSGFAGAAINAVTRSGTNEFAGSVFRFWNSRDLAGDKVASKTANVPPTPYNVGTTGFRFGGPIIKNKLFFFVNGEFTSGSRPALDWVANRSGATGNVSRTTAADLEDLKSFLASNFNYDLGAIDNFNNESYSRKVLSRIDWNINDVHKLSVRYAHHNSQTDVPISNSNSGNTAGNGNRQNNALAISGQNTGYIIQDNTRSAVVELTSNFKNRVSNQFLVTYNKQIEDRAYRTGIFPTVDILSGVGGSTYTSIGFDPFTPNNRLNYSTFNITNNTTLVRGNHTITLGAAFESFKSNNLFFYASNGVWVFNSIADFKTAASAYLANKNLAVSPVPIARFNYRYTLLPDGKLPWQTFQNQFYTVYGQDEWKIAKNFRLTYGVRLDYLNIVNTATDYANPYVSSLTFRESSGLPYSINTATMPKSRLYASPRMGFNWDVYGNRKTQVRGGSGLFLSRLPYVLISNQLGNNGVNIGLVNVTGATALNFPFTLDPTRYTPTSTDISALRGYNLNYSDPNLRFPQIWKSNIAVDQKLPFWGVIGTLEAIYNKNINMLNYEDVNLKTPSGRFQGPDTREIYPALDLSGATATNARFLNPGIGNAFVLRNNNVGYSYSLTAKLEKPVTKNFGGVLAYTYAKATDLSSVASTVNASTPSIYGVNFLRQGFSDNDLRHRFMGYVNYRFDYGKKTGGATTLSLGMVSASGFKLSYTYSSDVNGDGQFNDLIYVPRKDENMVFQEFSAGLTTYSSATQLAAYNSYIDRHPYLKNRRGQYAERNGAAVPWLTRLDFAVEQDFFVSTGKQGKKNTIRFRADFMNFGNLLKNNWGVSRISTTPQPLNYRGRTATGEPIYRLATQVVNGNTILLRDAFVNSRTLNDVYQVQLGVRYIFNN
jgi:hypothetical protein